ncbi:hypothetical protein [Dongia sp.]|uniref:hypothetical protein n=1 Tax=Dongia sp. TaxID=1977262 RepID=UPI0035AE7B6A
MKNIAWMRLALFAVAVGIGVAASVFGQPLVHGNQDAINTIVTIFSILAGFQIALITLLGDPGYLSGMAWQGLEARRDAFHARLSRQKYLFVVYLLTLALALFAIVIKDTSPTLKMWLEHGFLGLGGFAFALSLGLPWSLLSIQMHRYDALIEARRQDVGIKD